MKGRRVAICNVRKCNGDYRPEMLLLSRLVLLT